MDLKPVKGLRPFTRFLMTIGELPSSYLVSMTYEEQLLWFCNYLQNTVIPTINNNGEAVEELQNLFIDLKNYVDNYFESLDVQEEINNKLDEMAESGELTEIIAQYLNLAALFCYDTIADMAAAENLIEGSSCYCLGKDTYDDGKGGFYKIREITISDVIDGFNIVAITESVDLIGERLPNYEINQINSTLETLTETTIPGIQDDINTINNTTIPNLESTLESEIDNALFKKWIFIGDSYSQGYNPDGNVTGWSTVLKEKMGLDSNHCLIADYGGAGFANPSHPYSQILSDLTADNTVTDILIAGGYNDLGFTDQQIASGMSTCKTLIDSKFPNAKVHIAFIGGTTNEIRNDLYLKFSYYNKNTEAMGWDFLVNTQYALFNRSYFASDGVHITQAGENAVAYAIYEALNGGYEYCRYNDITLNSSGTVFNTASWNLRLFSCNDVSYFSSTDRINLSATSTININSQPTYVIGTLTGGGLIGGGYWSNQRMNIGTCVVRRDSDNKYYDLEAQLAINNKGELLLCFNMQVNDAHNNYVNSILTDVKNIQIPIFCITRPTITL